MREQPNYNLLVLPIHKHEQQSLTNIMRLYFLCQEKEYFVSYNQQISAGSTLNRCTNNKWSYFSFHDCALSSDLFLKDYKRRAYTNLWILFTVEAHLITRFFHSSPQIFLSLLELGVSWDKTITSPRSLLWNTPWSTKLKAPAWDYRVLTDF